MFFAFGVPGARAGLTWPGARADERARVSVSVIIFQTRTRGGLYFCSVWRAFAHARVHGTLFSAQCSYSEAQKIHEIFIWLREILRDSPCCTDWVGSASWARPWASSWPANISPSPGEAQSSPMVDRDPWARPGKPISLCSELYAKMLLLGCVGLG